MKKVIKYIIPIFVVVVLVVLIFLHLRNQFYHSFKSINVDYAKYFIGNSYLNLLAKTAVGLFLTNVTFEPGCRNN